MSGTFQPLIEKLENENLLYSEPQVFQKYLKTNNLGSRPTAAHISVQSLKDLKSDLKKSGYMVFRLGGKDKETAFALARLSNPEEWSEYFLIDNQLFGQLQPKIFIPNVSLRQLFAFNLLANLTENSLVNLAVCSGLLSSALGIDTSEGLAAPASAQGTFSFSFRANPNAPTWEHKNGQVEIDALFVGCRNGEELLFVIEAKNSEAFSSLSKHKLIYPILSLKSRVPDYIPIVPVYLRTIRSPSHNEISFYITECNPIPVHNTIVAISDLTPKHSSYFTLLGFHH